LKDQSLFIEKAYINGEWVDAKSGKTFEVHGKYQIEFYGSEGVADFFLIQTQLLAN
jgi:hypothetical protein